MTIKTKLMINLSFLICSSLYLFVEWYGRMLKDDLLLACLSM